MVTIKWTIPDWANGNWSPFDSTIEKTEGGWVIVDHSIQSQIAFCSQRAPLEKHL